MLKLAAVNDTQYKTFLRESRLLLLPLRLKCTARAGGQTFPPDWGKHERRSQVSSTARPPSRRQRETFNSQWLNHGSRPPWQRPDSPPWPKQSERRGARGHPAPRPPPRPDPTRHRPPFSISEEQEGGRFSFSLRSLSLQAVGGHRVRRPQGTARRNKLRLLLSATQSTGVPKKGKKKPFQI